MFKQIVQWLIGYREQAIICVNGHRFVVRSWFGDKPSLIPCPHCIKVSRQA